MRTLVELNNRIAVITWTENYAFPHAQKDRLDGLRYKQGGRFNQELTPEEERELKELSDMPIAVSVHIVKIHIAQIEPTYNDNYDQAAGGAFPIYGEEYRLIESAIETLRKKYKAATITLAEAIKRNEEVLPF